VRQQRRLFARENPRLRQTPNSNRLRRDCQHSIVSFDPPFDHLGFLNDKFRQMLLLVLKYQQNRNAQS
jgi:hypothetical protein